MRGPTGTQLTACAAALQFPADRWLLLHGHDFERRGVRQVNPTQTYMWVMSGHDQLLHGSVACSIAWKAACWISLLRVSVVNMPACAVRTVHWFRWWAWCAPTPWGMVRGIDCCLLPGAAQGAYYNIDIVNPCRTPVVSEIVDIQPVPESTVQESNAQTGERQFLHVWAGAASARERASLADESSLPGRDQSTAGTQCAAFAQPHALAS